MKFLPKLLTALLIVCYIILGFEISISIPILLIIYIPFTITVSIIDINKHILNH